MAKGIQKLFSEVPRTYECVNHILTFGMDIVWRKKAAKIGSASSVGTHWVDMCSGTGEMAAYLQRLANKNTHVYAADFSFPMLSRALLKPEGKQIHFSLSDIRTLPFGDNVFDLITISFATRNINLNRNVLIQCFQEFHRVLKPGGVFVNLETSQPSSPVIRSLFHIYIKLFVKPIGSIISGSRAGYTYLSQTIPKFYTGVELDQLMRTAGFHEVNHQKLLFGIAAIHQGRK